MNLMISFKHPAFEEQAEWSIVRFTLTSSSLTKFRIHGEDIVPYLSIPFDKGSVKPIYQCPRMHPVLSELAVRDLVGQNGYSGEVLIIGSKVPLRA
jgi:hypothetical protein